MKKIFLIMVMFACNALFATISAQDVTGYDDEKIMRIFYNGGEEYDFYSDLVDSLTVTGNKQLVWSNGEYTSFDMAAIDSVWYICQTLRIMADEINFGKVTVGKSIQKKLIITNTGKYPEVFMPYSDGVFSVEESGQYIKILPGESKSLSYTFSPKHTKYVEGAGLLFSNAIAKSLASIPLIGEGVESEDEEEVIYVPPVDGDVEIEVPDGASFDGLDLKIVNAYGEFPVNMQSSAKRHHRIVATDGIYENQDWLNTLFQFSPIVMQAHFVNDSKGNPFLFKFTLPSDARFKKTTRITVEDTALALLMFDALTITCDEAEYKNIITILKSLDSYPAYLKQVRDEYNNAIKNSYCPSYSKIDPTAVIHELFAKYRDNSWVPQNGIELKVSERNGEKMKYTVINNQKRLLHLYTTKANMNDGNLIPVETADDLTSVSDILQYVIDEILAKYNLPSIGDLSSLAEDDLEEINEVIEMKEWMNDLSNEMSAYDIGGLSLSFLKEGIPIPMIFESEKAGYWKIVKGSLQGDDSSIFQKKLENLEYDFDGYDKMFLDAYGLGTFNKDWNQYSPKEKFRIVIALMHGCYEDFVKNAIALATATKKWNDSRGSNNFKYDLRFGKRKYPEMALLVKFSKDFLSNKENMKTLAEDIKNMDVWATTRDLCVFICQTLLKEDSGTDAESKRTYSNLMYNIFKKMYFGTYGHGRISDKNRQTYKDVMNNITHLASTNFVGKTIKLGEAVLDMAGAVQAFASCDVMSSFVVDRESDASVTITSPTVCYTSFDATANIEWKVYKGSDGYGQWLADIVLYKATPMGYESFTVASNISEKSNTLENSYSLDLKTVSGLDNAVSLDFQIVLHHKDNPNMIYARSTIQELVMGAKLDENDFVDLGLTSGNLWAICNMGSITSNAYGNYYAWGELKGYQEGKTGFSWSNYNHCKGTANTLTKYCSKSVYGNNGFTDNLVQLSPFDDCVSCTYGYPYCIPTKDDWDELIRECSWSKLYNGVMGRGKNGNIIFLPCAGYRQGANLYDEGTEGYYWTSTLDVNSPDDAWYVYIGDGKAKDYDYYRCSGRSVRPIMRNVSNGSSAKAMVPAKSQNTQPTEANIGGGLVVKTMSGTSH